MSKKSNTPKKTDKNGRDENGRFTDGNKGKPKGAINKTTRDVREFITDFLNDKAFEIPHIWDAMNDKDKATLYLHLCKLVLPSPTKDPINKTNDSIKPIEWVKELTPQERNKRIEQLRDKLFE
jgi:hypothetical protein